jgi:hypothetical protein
VPEVPNQAYSQLQHGIQPGHKPRYPAKTALPGRDVEGNPLPMHGNTAGTLPAPCSTQRQATTHGCKMRGVLYSRQQPR